MKNFVGAVMWIIIIIFALNIFNLRTYVTKLVNKKIEDVDNNYNDNVQKMKHNVGPNGYKFVATVDSLDSLEIINLNTTILQNPRLVLNQIYTISIEDLQPGEKRKIHLADFKNRDDWWENYNPKKMMYLTIELQCKQDTIFGAWNK